MVTLWTKRGIAEGRGWGRQIPWGRGYYITKNINVEFEVLKS
jgi:hypothetical protein